MAEFGDRIDASVCLSIEPSSEVQYAVGVSHFHDFATLKSIPPDWYKDNNADNVQLVMQSFAEWLRATRKTSLSCGGPILAQTINEYCTHLVQYVRRDSEYYSDRLRSQLLQAQIHKFELEDTIRRGPEDSYCTIPLGCEFTKLCLDEVARRFPPHSDAFHLYCAIIALYYGIGSRVGELSDGNSALICLAPSGRRVIGHHAKTADLTVLHPRHGWIPLSKHQNLPQHPLAVVLALCHTKNRKDGALPAAIYSNPKGPHAPFCIPSIVCAAARHLRREPADVFFRGVDLAVLLDIARTVGRANGFTESRIKLRGWRSGSCMSTAGDILLSMAEATHKRIKVTTQGWASANGDAPYDKGSFTAAMAKTDNVYNMSINSVNEALAKYERPFITGR